MKAPLSISTGKRTHKGFSLIEILVVLTLFGILTLTAAISISTARAPLSQKKTLEAIRTFEYQSRQFAGRFNLPVRIEFDSENQRLNRTISPAFQAKSRTSQTALNALNREISIAPFAFKGVSQTDNDQLKQIEISNHGWSRSYLIKLEDISTRTQITLFVCGLSGEIHTFESADAAQVLLKEMTYE